MDCNPLMCLLLNHQSESDYTLYLDKPRISVKNLTLLYGKPPPGVSTLTMYSGELPTSVFVLKNMKATSITAEKPTSYKYLFNWK